MMQTNSNKLSLTERTKRKQAAIDYIFGDTLGLLHRLGLVDTTEMHADWLRDYLRNKGKYALMAHREAYKTSVICVGLALKLILFPKRNLGFFRKTDDKVREVVRGVEKHLGSLLLRKLSEMIWGFSIEITRCTDNEIETNYYTPIGGEVALYACGIGGSITSKHFDDVTTDDIVDKDDRYFAAKRLATHRFYDELQNTINRGGVQTDVGTPWHRNDCTTRFENVKKYPVSRTGLFNREQLELKKRSMPPELYSLNYDLDMNTADESLFARIGKAPDFPTAGNVFAYLDPSHKGKDYTSLCVGAMSFHRLVVCGFVWKKPWYEIYDNGQLEQIMGVLGITTFTAETNGVGDMPVKMAREKFGTALSVFGVNNTMPKMARIQTAAAFSESVDLVEFNDRAESVEFAAQIRDFDASAPNDDAPDSLAGLMESMNLIRIKR